MATEIKPSESARQFAAAEHPMLIGADWVEAADGRTFEVYDPSTGEVLGRVARGGVLVLGCLSNGLALNHVQSFYVQIITGIALIIAVIFGRLNQILTR